MLGVGVRSDGIALALVMREAGARPRLEFCEFRPYADHEQLAAVLGAAIRDHRLEGTPCVCVLEPGDYHLMLIDAPEVDTVELRQAVRWRIKDLIGFHIDEAVVDVFDLPQPRERRATPLMYVVAARDSRIRRVAETVAAANLELQAIDIAELALRNVVALHPGNDAATACLELGHQQGLITLFRQGHLYLARNVDLSLGSEPGQLSYPHLDVLALELQRSFDYCESHFDLPPPSRLLIAPLDPEPPGLADYLGENLGIEARVAELTALLDCPRPPTRTQQARCLLSIGAALRREDSDP